MEKRFKKFPLSRKVLLFSFCILFCSAISMALVSLSIQERQISFFIAEEAVHAVDLWSKTISAEEVKVLYDKKDGNHPVYEKLLNSVSAIDEIDPIFKTAIISPEVKREKVFFIVPSERLQEMGISSLTYEKGEEEYIAAILEAVKSKDVSFHGPYRDQNGLWITSVAPIEDRNGTIVGLLSVQADASKIGSLRKNMVFYMVLTFIVFTLIVYILLRRRVKEVINGAHDLLEGMNAVGEGNFKVKLPLNKHSELNIIKEQFNFMTEKLSVLFERLALESAHSGKERDKMYEGLKFEDAIGKMEQVLQETKISKELQRAEKMNAIGQLAASVAHEIRNPMTVVKGFLQIFQSKKGLTSEEYMYVKLMIDEINRAETIINDYLSLARPDLEQTERIDAGILANKVFDLMNSYAMMSKNIELRIFVEESVYLKGNTSELQQVLINILKNGIESMKDGGILTLRVFKKEKYGVFEIEDTGIGMSKEELDRLGTPFYSLKEKGTGMGLMVSYQIVERMKGSIEVKSQKGKGTIFQINIPLDES